MVEADNLPYGRGCRHSAEESGYAAYLAALSWGRLIVEAVPAGEVDRAMSREGAGPEGGLTAGSSEAEDAQGGPGKWVRPGGGRAVRVGFLVHSLLGAGLRRVSCPDGDVCRDACRRPGVCAYHVLLVSEGRVAGGVLSGVARVPSPCVVQADWEPVWRPGDALRFGVCLLGRAVAHARDVARALEVSLGRGVGSARVRMAIMRCLLSRGGLQGPGPAGPGGGDGPGAVTIELRTPLRLLRKRQPVRQFSLEELVRDLNFRLAVWGSYHQALPWAPRWAFLAEDARAARTVADDTRWVSFTRYSATQRRDIPLGGLIGSVTLEGVTPRLLALLRAAEIMGAGKGGTIGLGRVRVRDVRGETALS